MRNRSLEQIREDFLRAIMSHGENGLTAILRNANYEHRRGLEYLNGLIEERLIHRYTQEERAYHKHKFMTVYELTKLGEDYLHYLTAQNSLMQLHEQ